MIKTLMRFEHSAADLKAAILATRPARTCKSWSFFDRHNYVSYLTQFD